MTIGICAVSGYDTSSFKSVKPSGPSSKISRRIKLGILPVAMASIADIASPNSNNSVPLPQARAMHFRIILSSSTTNIIIK